MRGESEEGVKSYSEDLWSFVDGHGDVIDGDLGLSVHLTGPGSEEGDRGFFGGDAHFILPGPVDYWGKGVREKGGNGRGVWGDVRVGDGDGDVVRVGGDHLGRGGTVSDEEVEDAGGDDGTLWDAGVNGLEGGCCREVEAGRLPATEVGEQPPDPVGGQGRGEELAE